MLKKLAAIVFISANLCFAGDENSETKTLFVRAKETRPAQLIATIYNNQVGKMVLGLVLYKGLGYLPTNKIPGAVTINNYFSPEIIKTGVVLGTEYGLKGSVTCEMAIPVLINAGFLIPTIEVVSHPVNKKA